MKVSQLVSACFVVIVLVSLHAFAQSATGNTKHFSKDGLSFDYPVTWTLTDRSNSNAQDLVLARPGTSLLIMVVAYRDPLSTRDQLLTAHVEITEPYIRSLAEKFGTSKKPGKRDSACAKIAGLSIGGVQIRGSINQQPSTAEIYSFTRARRFLTLVYVRTATDDLEGGPGWSIVRDTLKIDAVGAKADSDKDDLDLLGGSPVMGGILNGKALSLPHPEYSGFARAAGASGQVRVVVVVDESGKVVSARAVSGHHLLHAAAESSAKGAKFSPTTLCGQPVKVSGLIIYNFVRL